MVKFFVNKKWNILSPELVLKISLALLVFFPILVIVFLWGESFTLSSAIDHAKLGALGDLFGGTVGPVWSLSGILLFYIALKEQREDLKVNKDALLKQIEALKLQADEFRLQRDEMSLARKVSSEQARTLQQQRIESTYFSLLDLYHKITVELNSSATDGNFFKEFKNDILGRYSSTGDILCKNKKAVECYLSEFNRNKEELSHYYRIVYRIIRVIEDSSIDDLEKFKYVKILRSRLSQNELFAIYYNSFTSEGSGFYKLILSFNLLKHLSPLSKMEFGEYKATGINEEELGVFVSSLKLGLIEFLNNLKVSLNSDSIGGYKESFRHNGAVPFIIAFESDDQSKLTVNLKFKSSILTISPMGVAITNFEELIESLLCDLLFISNYIEGDSADEFISKVRNDKGITYFIASQSKLRVNTDLE